MLCQQTRASEYVREGVEKNKVVFSFLSFKNKINHHLMCQGDCGPGKPDHGAEQRDGRAEGGEQRQPHRHQQAQGQLARDNNKTGMYLNNPNSPFHNLSFSLNLQALAHILVEFCLYYVDLQVCLDSDETGACRSPSPPCLSSTASLPSLPSGPTPALITYSRYEPGVPCLVPVMRFSFSGEDLQT